MSKWIDIKDKLPDDPYERVLVCLNPNKYHIKKKDDIIRFGWYLRGIRYWDVEMFDFWGEVEEIPLEDVTHWKHIPDLPKEK